MIILQRLAVFEFKCHLIAPFVARNVAIDEPVIGLIKSMT